MATYSSFKKIDTLGIISANVTKDDIAPGGIPSTAFASASVRTTDIAAASIGTNQLATTLDFSGKTMTYRPFVNGDFAAGSISGAQLASGAITTNIGYTTLNKAGDSTSGPLVLPAGSVSAPSIAASNNTNTGVYFPAASQINITTAGSLASNFVNNGSTISQVQPSIPAFHAAGNGGWYYGNSFGGCGRWGEVNNLQPGGGWTWQIGAQKGGSNLSSNGRFTAPVAGWYNLYAQDYMYSDTNNSNSYIHWNIGYNGSPSTDRNTGRTPHTIYGHGNSGNYVPGIVTTLEIYLNASDYVIPQPYWGGGCTGRIHGDHALWCGYLIG